MYEVFDPALLSLEDNRFLLEHLGEPPIVAFSKREGPQAATPLACREVLEGVYELVEMEKHRGMKWVGVDRMKSAILTFLEQSEKWEDTHRRHPGAPRFPSMYTFDSKGKAHWAGVGADVGRVRTYYDAEGNRVPFAINLVSADAPEWKPEWVGKEPDAPTEGLRNDAVNTRIECLICGHTERYNPDSRSSYNAARARISRHLRTYKDKVELVQRHREVHTLEFGTTSN